MKKSDFDQLGLNDKIEHVFKRGRHISSRRYYNHLLKLYDMGDFFTEIWHEPDSDKILKIESLTFEDKKIDRYIDSEKKLKGRPVSYFNKLFKLKKFGSLLYHRIQTEHP